jgi:hypothetical protein
MTDETWYIHYDLDLAILEFVLVLATGKHLSTLRVCLSRRPAEIDPAMQNGALHGLSCGQMGVAEVGAAYASHRFLDALALAEDYSWFSLSPPFDLTYWLRSNLDAEIWVDVTCAYWETQINSNTAMAITEHQTKRQNNNTLYVDRS